MKKTLSILLSIVMLLSITAGLDFSSFANTSGDYEYELLEDGTAKITKYIGTDTDVAVPTQIDGYTVSSIGFAFEFCKSLKSVTIPKNIISINTGNWSPFNSCLNLKNITVVPENNYFASVNGVLYNKNQTELIQYPVADAASSFIIPSTVQEIWACAFNGAKNIKNVKIPNGVTTIGQAAFGHCTGLTNVTIPGSVRSMREGAFGSCASLKSVVISEGVTRLGSRTFIYCPNLKSITIPKSFESLLWEFNGCNLTDVYYKGTKSDWNKLIINWHIDDQQSFAKATIYCTDGVINCKHKYTVTTTKATTKKNGSVVTKCSVCGTSKKTTIYYPKTITLSTTGYTYNGKVKKPSVMVKDSKGKKISSNNYTVTYSSGRKNVGKYTVTVKFKGNYSGTVKKTFIIKPKTTSISKLTAGKKKFTIKWKKQAAQTTGYQIQYSTSSKFKGAKTITVSKNKTTSKTISKLKAKKKYYVRIRTYKTVNGTKYYSSWSKAKSVTTKK